MSQASFSWSPFDLAGAKALCNRFYSEKRWWAPRVEAAQNDRISDITGIRVGHFTLDDGTVQTGCTAIDTGATPDNPVVCGHAIFNGFAKPQGLIQLSELGQLGGPILLGNTYSVGTLFNAMVKWSSQLEPRLGRELATFNPVVLECNDGYLNDLQAQALTIDHALSAINAAEVDFATGSIGAGRGMSCFGLKGGIGTSSRRVMIAGKSWQLGALVLTNFGKAEDFTLNGVHLGPWLSHELMTAEEKNQPEKGSIIVVLATDAPLDKRQLDRVARRAGIGIGRTGGYWGHGSGDIALALTTHRQAPSMLDHELDPLFSAAADATEGAIINALLSASAVTGFRHHHRDSLSQILQTLKEEIAS